MQFCVNVNVYLVLEVEVVGQDEDGTGSVPSQSSPVRIVEAR